MNDTNGYRKAKLMLEAVRGSVPLADVRGILWSVFNEIEQRAEANMLKTGKLEGMHYAALREVRAELGIERCLEEKPE